MKRYLTTALATSCLVAVLTGCVPLDQPEAVSSPAAETPLVEPMPSTPVPDLKTSSTEGLAERVSGLSQGSPARQILAETFIYDSAVPGSVQLLYAEKSVGGQRAIIALNSGADGIGYYVWCSTDTRFRLRLSDGNTGSDYGDSFSSCDTSGSSGGAIGRLPDGVESVFMDFAPSAEVAAEVVVFSFTSVPFDD